MFDPQQATWLSALIAQVEMGPALIAVGGGAADA
jgi:hypothetical protein